MSGTVVQDALAALRVAYDALAAAEVDLMDSTEIVAALDELERACHMVCVGAA